MRSAGPPSIRRPFPTNANRTSPREHPHRFSAGTWGWSFRSCAQRAEVERPLYSPIPGLRAASVSLPRSRVRGPPLPAPLKVFGLSFPAELGNSNSPSLDGGASSLPVGVEREIPEGAAGLLLCGADSPGAAPAAPVLADVIVPEEGKLSGTVS